MHKVSLWGLYSMVPVTYESEQILSHLTDFIEENE